MPKLTFQNGVMRIDADTSNNDDTITLKVKEFKGKGTKVANLSRPQLEALTLTMAKKLGIDLT